MSEYRLRSAWLRRTRLGLDTFDVPPPVPYDGPIHDIDGTLLPGQREAPDPALGRCQALIQCHLETGHEGDHEPDPGPFAQQRAAVLARCEQAPRKAPSGDYMRLVADIRAVLGAPPIEQSPNAFGGSADA